LKKTTDSKKEKIKEELESVDKTGLKKHNSETTLKLKVDFTKFGTDVFNQSNKRLTILPWITMEITVWTLHTLWHMFISVTQGTVSGN
jgi:hypothetical protein